MAYKYTWDDVQKAISNNGLFFSDADKKLAQSNPDAGMSIVNYKLDYKNATTNDQKALANSGAESIRKNFGNYTGGSDGSKYYLTDPSPMTFHYQQPGTSGGSGETQSSATQTSEFANPYADQQQAALDAIMNRKDWINPYTSDLQAAYDAIKNRQDFSYDPAQDTAWQSAKKMYAREADRATQDTMGQAAALTGGMPSTAAVTAASQAGDYYKAQMNDALGDYRQQAYQRYMDDVGLDYKLLETVAGMSDADYQKYIDDLGLKYDDLSAINSLSQQARSEFDTDRNFAYNQWTDELGFQTDKEAAKYDKEATEYEKNRYEQEYSDSKNSEMFQMYMALYEATGDSAFRRKAESLLTSMNK